MLTPDSLEDICLHAKHRLPCRGRPFSEDDWKWCLRYAQFSILLRSFEDESLGDLIPEMLGVHGTRRLAHVALRSLRRMGMVRSWGKGKRIKDIASNERWNEVVDKLADWLVAHMKKTTT